MSKKKWIKNITSALLGVVLIAPMNVHAVSNLDIKVDTGSGQGLDTVGLLILMTLISFLPSIVMTMTSFTRFIVVFSFLRSSIGTQNVPPNQVLVGLSLILTFFVFAPTFDKIKVEAYEPYVKKEIKQDIALDKAGDIMKDFMLKYTRDKDLQLFIEIADHDKTYPTEQDVPLHIVTPAFIISELKTAFEIGFLLFIPFIVVDIVVSSILMSMGMFMMPPTMISLPFKILLFVMIDGWHLLVESLVKGLV